MSANGLATTKYCCLMVALSVLGCARDERHPCAAIAERDLVVYEGSRVGAGQTVVPGERVSCRAAAPAGPVFAEALSRIPTKLRPRLTVHVAPKQAPDGLPLGPIEYHRSSKGLWVRADAVKGLTPSIALHEIAHVALDGARPDSLVARRLHQAVSEAVADYWAAQFTNSPRLGSERLGEVRDLSMPPRIESSEWARLALARPFPVHRFAHGLASILWREAPNDVEYLTDLAAMLAVSDKFDPGDDTPNEFLFALSSRCPERSRRRLLQALRTWLPPELVESS